MGSLSSSYSSCSPLLTAWRFQGQFFQFQQPALSTDCRKERRTPRVKYEGSGTRGLEPVGKRPGGQGTGRLVAGDSAAVGVST